MQNSKQNSNELLHENAQEATYLREKKQYERNARLKEEQSGLDRLNREIEDEARIQNSRKAQMKNEQYQEYTNYLKQKYEDNQNQKRSKNQLTEKIGGENRQIVRKNYDEMNNGLCLNPMREALDRKNLNGIQQTPTQQRKSSHGYNIINNQITNESSKYQTGASLQQAQRNMPTSDPRSNEYQSNMQREREYIPYEQQRPLKMEEPTGDYYQDQMKQHNLEQLQPLKPVSYQEQPKQDYFQLQNQKEKEPELTEEDYKRYYDYLNSLKKNENENGNTNENIAVNNEYQMPQHYENNHQQNELRNMNRDNDQCEFNNQANELTNQMHQLSLQEEARNEYLANKQKNRSSFNNLSDNSSHQQPQQQMPIDKSNPNTLKQDKQRMYKEYLDNQVKAKDVYKKTLNTLSTYGSGSIDQSNQNNQQSQVTPHQPQTNPYKAMREKNSKFNDIPTNPCKNIKLNFII